MTPHDASRPPDRIVFAHGFTQTARSWIDIERLLLDRLPGITTSAVDLPGHGDSDAPADSDLWSSAEHLVRRGGVATYVGYSMGGRVALHAALSHPDQVRALVLIGATAGIEDAHGRRDRRDADERLAARLESIGTEAFISEWLRNPLFAGLDPHSSGYADRLRNSPAGLAASLRSAGTGTQTPLWDRLDEITCPVLVLVGEQDPKFTSLGERLCGGIRDSTMQVIADAGHSVHLEQPPATADAIAAWLRTHGILGGPIGV